MYRILLILLYVCYIGAQSPEEIETYVKLIEELEKNYTSFQAPLNNEEYCVDSDEELDFGSFDFIVIGAGSTGSVVASRLSEIGEWSVLLLEAGYFCSLVNEIPLLGLHAQFSGYNWGYWSLPSNTTFQGLNGHHMTLARGKGVGGSSLINAMVYARANASDFEQWEGEGNPGWSFDDVLPYFKKSEHFYHNDLDAPCEKEFHGKNGPFHIEYSTPRSPQSNMFLKANRELGFDVIDLNSNRLGVSPTQFNVKHGKRWHVGQAFINPALYRKNFRVLTGSYVTKINIDPITKVAESVTFTWNGKYRKARIGKEVILSAGAFASPQILMLSGIGPEDHLKSLNIPVISNLTVGVLKNHPIYPALNFNTNNSCPVRSLKEYVTDFLHGKGELTAGFDLTAIGYYESSFTKNTGVADIELLFAPAMTIRQPYAKAFNFNKQTNKEVYGEVDDIHSFSIIAEDLHALSEGTIRLKSANPFEHPLIDTNYFSDVRGRDIQVLYEAIQLAINLTKTAPFQAINATLVSTPVEACCEHELYSKDYWYCAIKQVGVDLWHPVSTCKMGPNPKKGAVVDSHMKIYGVDKLRVADASIFPFSLTGHPQAVCVMIGEKLADILKLRYL